MVSLRNMKFLISLNLKPSKIWHHCHQLKCFSHENLLRSLKLLASYSNVLCWEYFLQAFGSRLYFSEVYILEGSFISNFQPYSLWDFFTCLIYFYYQGKYLCFSMQGQIQKYFSKTQKKNCCLPCQLEILPNIAKHRKLKS